MFIQRASSPSQTQTLFGKPPFLRYCTVPHARLQQFPIRRIKLCHFLELEFGKLRHQLFHSVARSLSHPQWLFYLRTFPSGNVIPFGTVQQQRPAFLACFLRGNTWAIMARRTERHFTSIKSNY